MEKIYKQCGVCKSPVKYICFDCSNNFYCESCFNMIHNKKENFLHPKFEIDYFIQAKNLCQEHPTIPLNLFCLTENGKIKYYIIIKYYRIFLCEMPLYKIRKWS